MIEIQLGQKTIEIQDTMSVEQYQRLQVQKLLTDNPDPAKLLAAYLDVPVKEIKNAEKSQVEFIEKIIFNRITQDISKDMIFTFDYNGRTYGFENNWGKLAWGAWQDLEFLSSEDINGNIHKLLAILYRPCTSIDGKKYKIEPYDSDTVEERAESFKKIPVKIWFGAAQVFFYISARYINNIKSSLELRIKIYQLMMKGTKILPKWLQKRLRQDFTSSTR